MTPEFVQGNVQAVCPSCLLPVTFEYRDAHVGDYGSVVVHNKSRTAGKFDRVIHKLLRCAVCKHPGVASVNSGQSYGADCEMLSFWPTAFVRPTLPEGTPPGVVSEFEEAALCASAQAWRATAALLRSALEKALRANGYSEPNLFQKLEAAGRDGVLTSARRQRAQDLVRTLGNDVLHDEWRPVSSDEAMAAMHYVGRVVEDFYDDRATVEKVLKEKKRLPES